MIAKKKHIPPHEEDLKHHAKTYHAHQKTTHAAHSPLREENELIEEGLNAIYGADKHKVDFTKLERSRSRLTGILFTGVIVLALLASASWGAFFVYTNYFERSTQKSFTVSLETPESLKSGEEATIAIRYGNPSNIPLAALSLDVKLPPAFRPTSMTPVPDDLTELIWNVGSLPAGSDGVILIEGTWLTSVPASTPVQVFADYRPANFNSDFQEIETVYIETSTSALETTMTGADEGQPGETLTYKITVKNAGDVRMEQAIVDLSLPEGFFLESSTPSIPAGSAPSWPIEAIEPGAEFNIDLAGSFAADKEGFQYFNAVTSIKTPERLLTQNSVQAFTDLIPANVALQLVVNGSASAVQTELGKDLRVSIALDNNGETNIEGATLLLDFQSTKPFPILWSKAELAGGTITTDGIFWNKEKIGTILAGKNVVINLTFPLEPTLGSGQADAFVVVAEAHIGDQPIRSTPIDVAINSNARIQTGARYYDASGTPLGSGPLPPTVGETTRYQLEWVIENTLHDLNSIEVSASLPPGVAWLDSTHADLGNITYNEATRTLTWTVAAMPTTVQKIRATADISITPEKSQVGKFVKLISGSSFRAKDTVTGALLQTATESLDTELPEDEFAKGNGVVIE